MKIADNAMKTIGVFLVAGLVGCHRPDAAPELSRDIAPNPESDRTTDAGPCSPEVPECRPWWEPKADLADVTPQGISYNQLSTEALMKNGLLNNAQANKLIANFPGGLFGLLYDPDNLDARTFRRQLGEPFALLTMDYLVSCALPAGPPVDWTNPELDIAASWKGELGLCPQWEYGPMDEACRELISACLLAKNNAFGREVLISVRGGSPAVLLADRVKGGEPCESGVQSFEVDCPLVGPNSNCKGWRSEYVGTCAENQDATVTVEVERNTSALVRICHGVSGCDYVDPRTPTDFGLPVPHVASKQMSCGLNGPCGDTFRFRCTRKEAFTLMSAWGSVNVLEMAGGIYPAPEPAVFQWQEGAFYGNLLCGANDPCTQGSDDQGASPVDFSLWVEVCDDVDEGCDISGVNDDCDVLDTVCDNRPPGTVVYQWNGGAEVVYEPISGSDRDRLLDRASRHWNFISRPENEHFGELVFPDMYSCMSPNWARATAIANYRLCGGPTGGQPRCAAQFTGRCWALNSNVSCQCKVYDEGTIGDRDYGECMDAPPGVSLFDWKHPVTVFLNDTCDIVPENIYADPAEPGCPNVPLCLQTTIPKGKLPPP